MKPRILIEIKGGCLTSVTTDGDVAVFLQDHDNHDAEPEAPGPVPVDEVLTRDQFTRRLETAATV